MISFLCIFLILHIKFISIKVFQLSISLISLFIKIKKESLKEITIFLNLKNKSCISKTYLIKNKEIKTLINFIILTLKLK